MERAALGFTIKSGWTAAVLVSGPVSAPRALAARRVELSDPDEPDARQPYHAGFGTARTNERELARLLASVRTFGGASMARAIDEFRAQAARLSGAGLVVGSVVDPATIANDHIRIHALEGQLFREVVRASADGCGLDCTIWRERDLLDRAAEVLAMPAARVRTSLAAMRPESPGPWRAEQKAAALAAWLVLAGTAQRRRV